MACYMTLYCRILYNLSKTLSRNYFSHMPDCVCDVIGHDSIERRSTSETLVGRSITKTLQRFDLQLLCHYYSSFLYKKLQEIGYKLGLRQNVKTVKLSNLIFFRSVPLIKQWLCWRKVTCTDGWEELVVDQQSPCNKGCFRLVRCFYLMVLSTVHLSIRTSYIWCCKLFHVIDIFLGFPVLSSP